MAAGGQGHMADLATKLLRSSFTRVFNLAATILITLFMMPFVINSIGDRWYGLWILAGSFTGYFGFLDLGLSTANERFISRILGTGDYDEANRIFNTCLFLFVLAGLLTIVVSVVIAALTPVFVDNARDIFVFRFIILSIGVTMAVSFPVRAFEGILYAHVNFYFVNILDTAKLILRTALLLFFLSRGYGIITLAIISLGSEILQHVATIGFVMKRHPEISIGSSHVAKSRIRPLFGYSIYSFISNVADKLKYHLDAFVITAVLGLSYVTHYNIGSRISSYYILLITAATALVMPVFSRLEGLGDYDQMRKKFIFFAKLNTMLSVFLGGLILVYGKAFISRWVGENYLDSYQVLVALMVGSIFATIQITSKSLLYDISKHRAYAFTAIIEGVANLVLSLILVRSLGIVGVALGTTIPALVVNCFVLPVYAHRIIKLPLSSYARVVLGAVFVGAAVHVGCWLIVRDHILSSYTRIILLGAATSLVFVLINAFTLLSREERRYLKMPV
jgi:O-antigen/teichoic acid export membrane protein